MRSPLSRDTGLGWHTEAAFFCGCQFRVNEFGVLEVITEDAEPEGIKKAHATTTWAIPTAQEGKHCLFMPSTAGHFSYMLH